ncbi:AraC family transcriptional regulator [Enterobacterales bacterium CwR94]|nr:AraC family transcriptional regulator [Enterobacterales bacterium CwR94]
MTQKFHFSFADRPLVPYAHDYPHGAREPRHYHDCAQLIHTLSGVVRVETDAGSWVVPPSRGVWLPAGVEHALTISGKVAARALFVDPLARADLPASCQVVQISPLLRELINAAFELPEHYDPASRSERIYELILDEIRVMSVLPFWLPEPGSATLQQLCQQIKARPGEEWTLQMAADIVSVSSRTLARRFHQECGISFGDWLRRSRLMQALILLAQGEPVLKVALDLGYESHSAFSAMFRRVMGVAPSDYFADAAIGF